MGSITQDEGISLSFIGCGNMGSAVASGLLSAASGSRTDEVQPKYSIGKIYARVNSDSSAKNLKSAFADHAAKLTVLRTSCAEAMDKAEVVVLGFKPYMVQEVLEQPGVLDALRGKLVISLIAGVPVEVIERYLIGSSNDSSQRDKLPHIIRVMPTLGATVKESMTVIQLPRETVPQEGIELTKWMFSQIGRVKVLTQPSFDIATTLLGASIAVTTVLLDGMLDGCVAEGMKRSDAREIAAQCLLATGKLLLEHEDESPSSLREKISSPRGVTIQALITAEKGAIRGTAAQAIINGTQHTKTMSS
ncbi:pyrroline-5-carboxylate reductase [Exophiala mesophila]|uniref:Pyrroline-5-carboxylate reductase n=1 Tax=Exophiala mesophila TaxID=212818 RepID=A0A0D1Z406_EXOME|nr:pyrroline-5-carboxylate reductase [Exophiala mesophila]KIV88634.1 pyrroline-5-carboxylate reductase [Exophiala mesophila]